MSSGSTLSAVVVSQDKLRADVAIVGDSPIVIFDRAKSLWIAPEHNVRTNMFERMAAIERGAVYEDGYIRESVSGVGVQLSRVLGDRELDPFLNREPELFSVLLGPESFIIVGSDGLLDPKHENTKEQISRVIALVKKGAGAKDLVCDALDRKTGDNVTAIVWRASL
jgi:serine/threonine protein phosphatase PrpC